MRFITIGFMASRESAGVPGEVVVEATGLVIDLHGCELRSVGTATLNAEETQVSVFLSHLQSSNGAPKVMFSPSAKQGSIIRWFGFTMSVKTMRIDMKLKSKTGGNT